MRRYNPTVGEHRDFFEPGPTPIVRALDVMSDEEVLALPRSAFSDEEWKSLDARTRKYILEHDPDRVAREERRSRGEKVRWSARR